MRDARDLTRADGPVEADRTFGATEPSGAGGPTRQLPPAPAPRAARSSQAPPWGSWPSDPAGSPEQAPPARPENPAGPPWSVPPVGEAPVDEAPGRGLRRLLGWLGPTVVLLATGTLTVLTLTGALDTVPLLNPVAAATTEAVGGLVLAASWWSRQVRWWRWRLPATILIAGAVTGAVAAALRLTGTVTDPYPPSFAAWVALGLASLAGIWWTVPRGGQLRRTVALAAVPLTACGAFLLINDEYGLWPTLGDLAGHDSTGADLDRLLHLPPGSHPDKGVVAAIDVPATRSHFTHRPGSVYLPPAFFGKARARLPVIVMLAGTPGSPAHWINAGHAVETADAYATAHHGDAPIMIFVDQNGSATGDTECVDGPQGNAETFLTVDVPTFVSKTLKVKPPAGRWAVVGFSEGGTCALDLTLGHPAVFHHLADLAGDLTPTLGDRSHTLSALFGGSSAARAAHDATRLLATHRYKGLSAWFAAGAADTKRLPVAQHFATVAKPAGLTVHEFTGVGGHNWQFASDAFRRILPALCHDLGLKG